MLAVREQPVGGELLTRLQLKLSQLTADAEFRVVQGAGHESLISQREHALDVAAAIRAVVRAARDRRVSQPQEPKSRRPTP